MGIKKKKMSRTRALRLGKRDLKVLNMIWSGMLRGVQTILGLISMPSLLIRSLFLL